MLSYFSNNRWSLQNALNRQENRIVGGGTSLAGSEMTALDLWRTVSIAFIYAACAEFVLVNFLGKRSTKKSKVSQLQELLDHQRQKMQQQLDKLRLEFNSRMNMRASTPQVSFCYVYQSINTRYKYLGNFEKIQHVFWVFFVTNFEIQFIEGNNCTTSSSSTMAYIPSLSLPVYVIFMFKV